MMVQETIWVLMEDLVEIGKFADLFFIFGDSMDKCEEVAGGTYFMDNLKNRRDDE